MTYLRMFLPALACLICAGVSAAGVPQTIFYQGVLTDAAGAAVPDGPYNITFHLYDSESGGTMLWSETVVVQVHKGIFDAMLGATQPFNLPFDAQYWLGMSIEGGAELRPRAQLGSAAYSLNARSVDGDQNIFPSTGNVGIGTKSPLAPLHIVTDNYRCLQIDGLAGGAWASILLNAQDGGSIPSIEYMRAGGYKARTYLDIDDSWKINVGLVNVFSALPTTGNIGIGIPNPLEKLDVDGGIRLGRTAATNAGTMRWTGFDFEGYDGSSWKSFTATGAGGLPSGTAGQTLRHDGASWVANDNIYNDGTNVGIGTMNPQFKLHVNGLARFDLPTGQVNVSTPGGWPGFIAYTQNGNRRDIVYDNNGMYLTPSPSSSPASATNGIVLRENGDVGIGTYDPTTKLHLAGTGPTYATVEAPDGFAPGIKFDVNGNTKWAILYHPVDQSLQFTKWTTEPLAYLTDDGRFILGPDAPAGDKVLEIHDPNPTTGHAAIAGYSYYNAPPSFGGAIGILGSHSDDGVGGVGVYGEGISGSLSMPYQVGVYGYTNAGYGVYSNGTLGATGATTSIVDTRDFGWRHTYAMQSPGNWIEDFGSARLSGGEARVELDPVFAQTVSLSEEYHVFLTPLGDCALYVAEKNEKGFIVKAVGGAASDVGFDYRIVAKRSGYETKRLEAAEDPALMEQRLGVGRAMTAHPQKRASGGKNTRPITGQ